VPTVDLAQGGIHYRAVGPDYGAAPPVVFAHGLLCNGEVWTGVADVLISFTQSLSFGRDFAPYGHRIGLVR
jgi:pimeloyl-ACP methyl ester carboxylesterase